MDAVSSSPAPLRFVIFPWLGFGHLLPYLELGERLALRGHRVSFVSTPGNIALLPTLRPAAAPRVDLVAPPLPRVDGLPDGAESTNSVPHDKFELLFKAFDGLAAPFAEFLGASCTDEGKRPDWVIVDCFHYWAAGAAVVDNKVRSHQMQTGQRCQLAFASVIVSDPARLVTRCHPRLWPRPGIGSPRAPSRPLQRNHRRRLHPVTSWSRRSNISSRMARPVCPSPSASA